MDSKFKNNVELMLIQHYLLNSKAESIIRPAADDKGGNIEFSISVDAPDLPITLKENDSLSIRVTLDCTGTEKETQNTSFIASCSMIGHFQCFNCDDTGTTIENNIGFWMRPANLLFPLVAQHIYGLITKMGYKGINVPPFIPFVKPPAGATKPQAKKSK